MIFKLGDLPGAVATMGLLFSFAAYSHAATSLAVLVPTSENTPQIWRYTTARPAAGWEQPGFDASAWQTGPAPFGQGYGNVNTPWTNTPGDIWLRREVTLPDIIPARLNVLNKHDEDLEVYVNGIRAAVATGFDGNDYNPLPMSEAARASLKAGASNVIAVHCHQSAGGQIIDVGIAEAFTMRSTVIPWQATANSVTWKSSVVRHLWQDHKPLVAVPWDNSAGLGVAVNPAVTFQIIDGWGGCFNERGWAAMSVLEPADREKVMRAIFDPGTGLKLNICRTPIGASDYAITPYSLDDTVDNAPDYEMNHFSIARDHKLLIPFIQAAMKIRPDLKIWGVPWSPPTWMKTNGKINTENNGFMKSDPQTMTAYALYFEKFIQAYQDLGINLFMVAPQNEPTQATSYPGCFWTGEVLRDFLVKYIGPKLKADNVHCQTWLGTPTIGRVDIVEPTLNDPTAAQYVTGYGLQYSAYKLIPNILSARPTTKIMETETPCGDHQNDWTYAEGQFGWIKMYLDAGANSYMLWNMVLDQDGSNWTTNGYASGWRQCSPVIVNQITKVVTYTPQFYGFKHFAYFVQPGARRVETTGDYMDRVAFRNPNGDVVLVMQNSADFPLTPNINLGGKKITPTLQPHSWNTFVLAAGDGKRDD
jgi:glucosylceramidase